MVTRFGRSVRGTLLALLVVACGSSGGGTTYPTPAVDAPLGVAWDSATGEATFRVWAPAAGSVSVLFFDTWNAPSPTGSAALAKDRSGSGRPDKDGWNGTWSVTVPGVASGRLYQYQVDGARVLDPYAPSMTQFDSSSQAVGRGAVVDLGAIQPRDLGAVGEPPQAMIPFTRPTGYARREDAVIYEVHVRDFTIKATGLVHPKGSYTAFTERLAHVRDLGATHVQLLPVQAYYYGDESQRGTYEAALTTGPNNYNWGYDPQSWFAPEGMYSADPTDPALRVQELKTLVNEAHKLGLGVILDVVYNHTATTAILDPLAPGYYYRAGSNSSGVGNDTASERLMMHRLVVDSIRHLVATYQVDGFRFDLMGLLDSRTILDAYQAANQAAASLGKPEVLFLGEGWLMSGVPAQDDQGNAIVPADQRWMAAGLHAAAVFSDAYRDIIKGGGFGEGSDGNTAFLTLQDVSKGDLLRDLRGDPTNFSASTPADSVQYLTAHDGLTLHDKLGKILALPPDSAEIPRLARLGFALQATSQGIVFVNGGCEFGRSKQVPTAQHDATSANAGGVYYVQNSYDSSDAVNGFDWTLLAAGSEGKRLSDYVAGLLALRRSSDAFKLGDRALAAAHMTMLDPSRPNAVAYQVTDVAGTTRFSVFVNAGTSATALATGADLTGATVVVDSDEAGATAVASPSGFTLTPTAITVSPRTAVVLRSHP